jgi:hypothetical protein
MALKKKKQKKKVDKKPVLKSRGKLFILDGRTPLAKTAMNRDIPLVMGGGGSPNLMSALAGQQLRPVQAPQPVQTPDAFKVQQDIKDIKRAQVSIGEELLAQRRNYQANPLDRRAQTYYGQESMPMQPTLNLPREVRTPMKIQPNPFDTYGLDDKITMTELPSKPVDFSQSLVGMDGGGIMSGMGVGATSAGGATKPIDIDAEWEYFQRTGELPP